ncbi:hypothetical protein Z517_08189 [Fonsecaea pedrosoi CBS 271.37]|uniref:Unplaced genomic scaffold supercont1.5, whole genome shotgun sequence n=1 Tax=Fonsecaea pedrosoi CBS 271.37 TaxID=1442368 RepID=A0A0D2H0Y8_9EURO|nr:uncharacterized protein Z517_08189 [Fonsecaea pedrosoi CBS 271.37]KIW78354.1 hypothetical protein Z517_08189 [Fonsecaea pedrosoi CBS 271.37]
MPPLLPRRHLLCLARPFRPATTTSSRLRPMSTTAPRVLAAHQDPDRHPHPQRDAQMDREKMNPEANEYSKSGTDDASAANEEAAFNPDITDPQEAKKKAGEGNQVNPLDASPANPDISRGTAEEEGGAKKKMSEGGGGRKGGGEAGKGEQST